MKAALIANTPAQLHFYEAVANVLAERGHESVLLVRDYGETGALLQEKGLAHRQFAAAPRSKWGKVLALPGDVRRAARIMRQEKADVVSGFGTYDAYASTLARLPCVVFTDSEPRCNTRTFAIQVKMFMPFVDEVVTPSFFRDDLGKKQRRVESIKEWAYLWPTRRNPAPRPDFLGIPDDRPYALVRLNAFDAVHDAGVRGFDDRRLADLVGRLQEHMAVFISPEAQPPKGLEHLVLPGPRNAIHAVLEHASLLVTDTQTMASEAALLGTPTVRSNDFVGPNDMGNFIMLEERGMMVNHADPEAAIEAAGVYAAKGAEAKAKARELAAAYQSDSEDVAAFMADRLEAHARQ
ncbi:MAG: hypothetical protein ACPGQL_06155 [Thermoplasmatota archaeon]